MFWHTITLSADDNRNGIGLRLLEEFDRLHGLAGSPVGAIVYGDRGRPPDLRFFFTPLAVSLAGALLHRYGSVECESPDLSKLRPLSEHRAGEAHS